MDGVLDLPTSNNTDTASDRELGAFEIEQRFLLTHAQTVAFLRAVSAHIVPELHDRARPLSFTRTTYLDSVDLAYLRSCAGRVARRLRLREYAVASTLLEPPLLTGDCFLELKESAGTVRSKLRLAAPRLVVERIIDGSLETDTALDCLADARCKGGARGVARRDRRAAPDPLPDDLVPPVEPRPARTAAFASRSIRGCPSASRSTSATPATSPRRAT